MEKIGDLPPAARPTGAVGIEGTACPGPPAGGARRLPIATACLLACVGPAVVPGRPASNHCSGRLFPTLPSRGCFDGGKQGL